MNRFNSFADILAENNLTQEQFDKQNEGLPSDEVGYRKRKLITKAYNGDWVPDYTNRRQDKWEILFYYDEKQGGFVFYNVNRWFSYSYVGSRLCFKSSNDAKEAATVFINELREFLQ